MLVFRNHRLPDKACSQRLLFRPSRLLPRVAPFSVLLLLHVTLRGMFALSALCLEELSFPFLSLV